VGIPAWLLPEQAALRLAAVAVPVSPRLVSEARPAAAAEAALA
jgi:hypothetical protein